MKAFAVLVLSALSACASIEHKTTVAVPVGVERTAGVGDLVFRATTEKSLPNALGRADVFGRTTPTAQTVVVYEGLRDGKLFFSRASTDIDTGATTMNSSPIVIDRSSTTTTHGFVGGTPFTGTSTTSSTPVFLPPATPQARVTERSRNLIAVEAKDLPRTLVVDGTRIRVLTADALTVKYIVEPN